MAATVVISLHEFAYRRFIAPGDTDYDLGGTVSHAASDMIALSIVLVVVAYLVSPRKAVEE